MIRYICTKQSLYTPFDRWLERAGVRCCLQQSRRSASGTTQSRIATMDMDVRMSSAVFLGRGSTFTEGADSPDEQAWHVSFSPPWAWPWSQPNVERPTSKARPCAHTPLYEDSSRRQPGQACHAVSTCPTAATPKRCCCCRRYRAALQLRSRLALLDQCQERQAGL